MTSRPRPSNPHCAIITDGARGDVEPYLALAAHLVSSKSSHVHLITNSNHAVLINNFILEQSGLAGKSAAAATIVAASPGPKIHEHAILPDAEKLRADKQALGKAFGAGPEGLQDYLFGGSVVPGMKKLDELHTLAEVANSSVMENIAGYRDPVGLSFLVCTISTLFLAAAWGETNAVPVVPLVLQLLEPSVKHGPAGWYPYPPHHSYKDCPRSRGDLSDEERELNNATAWERFYEGWAAMNYCGSGGEGGIIRKRLGIGTGECVASVSVARKLLREGGGEQHGGLSMMRWGDPAELKSVFAKGRWEVGDLSSQQVVIPAVAVGISEHAIPRRFWRFPEESQATTHNGSSDADDSVDQDDLAAMPPPCYSTKTKLVGFLRNKTQGNDAVLGKLGPDPMSFSSRTAGVFTLEEFLDTHASVIYFGWGSVAKDLPPQPVLAKVLAVLALSPGNSAVVQCPAAWRRGALICAAGGEGREQLNDDIVCLAAELLAEALHIVNHGLKKMITKTPSEQRPLLSSLADTHLFLTFRTDLRHDILFRRCAATIHHGGCGTMGASLTAGVVTIVTPHYRSTPSSVTNLVTRFVTELGVGVSLSDTMAGIALADLVQAVQKYIGDEAIGWDGVGGVARVAREQAAKLGVVLRAEDGMARMMEVLDL